MLARSFMTHKELKITAPQHAALIKVLHMLERGELKHVIGSDPNYQPTDVGFNMEYWQGAYSEDGELRCGTVCCIGGWVETISRVRLDGAVDRQDGLFRLFYPGYDLEPHLVEYSTITVEQAAHALSNYLTTGEPCWTKVLGLKA